LGIGDESPGIEHESSEIDVQSLGSRCKTPRVELQPLGISFQSSGIRPKTLKIEGKTLAIRLKKGNFCQNKEGFIWQTGIPIHGTNNFTW
jgi:hypothetical protein